MAACALVLSLGSCKKGKFNNMLGVWEEQNFSEQDTSTVVCVWTFRDDGTCTCDHQMGGVSTEIYHGYFDVKFQKMHHYLEITPAGRHLPGAHGADHTGLFYIYEQDRTRNILIREEGNNMQGEWSTGGEVYLQFELLRL